MVKANREACNEVKGAKLNFEQKLSTNIKKDTKSFFAYVRSKNKSKITVGPLTGTDGQPLESAYSTSNEFNNYFASVFTAENMRDIPDPAPTFQGSEAEKLTDIEFGIEDVKRVLSKLRADKASGVDELLPRFLSEIQETLAYPLYVMWRKSLNEGVVPDDWKRANVTPIYK